MAVPGDSLDVEADDQFGPGVRVAAEQEHVLGIQGRAGAGEDLDQEFLRRLAVGGLGQGDQGLGDPGHYAGGVEIGTGVDRGHSPDEPWVVGEGGERIERSDDLVAGRCPVSHCVVGGRHIQG